VALAGRGFRVYIDGAALALDCILVSAGQRGFDLELAPADLVEVTGARPVTGVTRVGKQSD
jgi:Cys-tRNA(Pro)/Cys-tRNA(Cys) deacylase